MEKRQRQTGSIAFRALRLTLFAVAINSSLSTSGAGLEFNFSGVATSAQSKQPREDFTPGIGGAFAGDSFEGRFVLPNGSSASFYSDSHSGGELDRFSSSPSAPPSADNANRDIRFYWTFGSSNKDSGDVTQTSPSYPFLPNMTVELVDAPIGDSITIRLRRNTNANQATFINLEIVLTDPTGNAFAGSGGLTSRYEVGLGILSAIDLGAFPQARGKLNYDTGGHSIYREELEFSVTSITGGLDTSEQSISLISMSSGTAQGADGTSWDPALSADGQLVAFSSDATNLIENERNGSVRDIFLYNRATNAMRNLTNGGNGLSEDPVLSKDGRWLAFVTSATNLPTDVADSNGAVADIVLAEVATGALTLVTAGADAPSRYPSLSRDGRRLTFDTRAVNLASSNYQPIGCANASSSADLPCYRNVLLYDRVSQFTLVLTQGTTTDSYAPSISESGTHVAFISKAFGFDNSPVVVMNIETGERRSIDFDYGYLALDSSRPILSANARWVAVNSKPFSPRAAVDSSLHLYDLTNDVAHFIGLRSDFPGEFSSDEQVLVYSSDAVNPDGSDPNGRIRDIYQINLDAGAPFTPIHTVQRGNAPSGGPVTNSDGSITIWDSSATNFAPDNNGDLYDVFVRDIATLNQPPSAHPQSLTVTAGETIDVRLTGFDPDFDALTFEIETEPSHGVLTGVPPNLQFSANSFYSGPDSFTFIASDGLIRSAAAQITIDVQSETSMAHTLSAVQREDSRIIEVQVTWPATAVWTQVREFDGVTGVLWDGQATVWNGTFTPEAAANNVSFNSRYWLPGVTVAHDNIDLTVQLRPESGGSTFDIGGDVWIDADRDSLRDSAEAGEAGRAVILYRCEAPWGIAGDALSQAPGGAFGFNRVSPGEYQIGTAADTTFSAVAGDNVVYGNGFSNCFLFNGAPVDVGIGVQSEVTDPGTGDTPAVLGYAWQDSNADGRREASEAPERAREVTMYHCDAPWGVAGSAITDGNGEFLIEQATAGRYQFGTSVSGGGFSPLGFDNVVHANGFTACLTVNAGESLSVGVGVLP